MSNITEITAILKRMSELAQIGGSVRVKASLEHAAAVVERDPEGGSNAILAMYGGMGSLNDVILYQGLTPLIKENNEFDELRTKLYSLCYKIR